MHQQPLDQEKMQQTPKSKYYTYSPRVSKNTLKINTSRSRGELRLLKQIIKSHPKWTEVFKQGDVMWSGLAMGYEDIGIASEIRLNRFPEMKHICHKKTMGYILNKFVEYWPEQYWFYPKTYLIPEEVGELENDLKSGKMFIAKPSAGSQGDGITIINRLKDIPSSIYNQQFVVQPYIDKPLLIQGKKFDLRLYVLVTSLSPYLCYLNQEGLARFCAEEYQMPTKQNLNNPYIHLTNYSLNKNHQKFVVSEGAFGKGSKQCFKVLWEQMEQKGIDVQGLRERIDEVARKFMIGLYPFMKYYYHAQFPKADGKCFQIIGLDILIDHELTPWILEANSNPSLNIEHQVYKSNGQTTTQISEIDEYVKRMVIEDAIFLTKKSLDSQIEIQQGDLYYSYKKIINESNDELLDMNIFEDMLRIFHSLGGVKTKATLTSSQFSKLSRYQGMTSDKLTKNDYHLIFIKVMRFRFNPNAMDFEALIEALEYLTSILRPYQEGGKYQELKHLVSSLVLQIPQA